MEKFFTELATPYWWASVVFIGVAVNLLSSYLKGPIDRASVAAFERYKERKRKQGEGFEAGARVLATEKDARD